MPKENNSPALAAFPKIICPRGKGKTAGQKIVYNEEVIRDIPKGRGAAGEYRLPIKSFEFTEGDHYGQSQPGKRIPAAPGKGPGLSPGNRKYVVEIYASALEQS